MFVLVYTLRHTYIMACSWYMSKLYIIPLELFKKWNSPERISTENISLFVILKLF